MRDEGWDEWEMVFLGWCPHRIGVDAGLPIDLLIDGMAWDG
jgi:hypothetical protein